MTDEKKSEVMAVLWFMASVLVSLSLFSYTPNDIPFEVSTANLPIHNYAGVFGAYLAWGLILFFGKTAYFLIPLFLLWSLAKWVGKKGQRLWLKIFAITIFFVSACAFFSIVGYQTSASRFQYGGLIGFLASKFLTGVFGKAAIIVALLLFLLSITLTTEFLVLQLLVNLFHKVRAMLGYGLTAKAEDRPKEIKKVILEKPKQPVSVKKPELEPKAEIKPTKPEIKINIPKIVESKPVPKPEPKAKTVEPEPIVLGENYKLPPLDLLMTAPVLDQSKMTLDLEGSSALLENTLRDFGIDAKVVEVEQGPTITRYELQPAAGVKVQRITSLENDIALAMRATSVRIIAPIPGKPRVGIEVPNVNISTVYIRDVLASKDFFNEKSKIGIVLGKDTAGAPLVCNLSDMPHLLIAGATNTGKSVCINSVISSILYRSTPDEVKFLMIDPKMVELHFYNDLPHLIAPVITDKSKAPAGLAWAVSEMERRYRILSRVGARNILAFNEKVEKKEISPKTLIETDSSLANDEPILVKKMPFIVIVIDELADLILASQQEVETAITRLAQLARAVGIHMILATQRPSVDVITGVIKANFPARIAFQVASKVDSRTILDENGADKLLGRGDFLFMDPRKSKLIRGQGAWVQDKEIEKVTAFIKAQKKAVYQEGILQVQEKKLLMGDFKRDEIYEQAKKLVLDTGQASVSMVQRRLGLGYTRAARLIDMMEEEGVVGPYRGAKPREILVERPNDPKKTESTETSS